MTLWKPLGLIASGRMGDSLLLRRPALARHLGPVVAANVRLATRYANRLRAGFPASTQDLRACGLIVLHAPPTGIEKLRALLRAAGNWQAAHFVLLSDQLDSSALEEFRSTGAHVCSAAAAPAPARDLIVAEGDGRALRRAQAWLQDAHLRCLELAPRTKPLFLLGVHAPASLMIPLLDAALQLLRAAGLSSTEARQMLRHLGQAALQSFAARGRRAWEDPMLPDRVPALASRLATLAAADPRLASFLEALLAAVTSFYHDSRHQPADAAESRVLRVRAGITNL